MAAAVYAARIGLVDAGVSPAARLALLIVIGGIVYAPLAYWRVPELRAFAARLRLQRRVPAAAEAAT
jgi:hypothetical protein